MQWDLLAMTCRGHTQPPAPTCSCLQSPPPRGPTPDWCQQVCCSVLGAMLALCLRWQRRVPPAASTWQQNELSGSMLCEPLLFMFVTTADLFLCFLQACPNVLDLKCSALKGCFGRLAKVRCLYRLAGAESPASCACTAARPCRRPSQLAPAAAALQGIAAIVGPLTALLALVFAYRTGYLQILFRALSAMLFSSRPAAASKGKDSSRDGEEGKHARKQRQRRPSAGSEEEQEEGSGKQRAPQRKAHRQPADEDPPEDAIAAVHAAPESGRRGSGASSEAGPSGRRLRRGSSGSFARARASVVAAAQQAHEILASLRNLVTNPLAAAGSEQPFEPLPVRVAMVAADAAPPLAAAASPVIAGGWAALAHASPVVPFSSPSPAAAPLLAPAPAAAPAAAPPAVVSYLPPAWPVPGPGGPAGMGVLGSPALPRSPLAQPGGGHQAGCGPAAGGTPPAAAAPAHGGMSPAAPLPAPRGGATSARAALEQQLRQVKLQRQQLRECLQQQQQQAASASGQPAVAAQQQQRLGGR